MFKSFKHALPLTLLTLLCACQSPMPNGGTPSATPSPTVTTVRPAALKSLNQAALPAKLEAEYNWGGLALALPKDKYTLSHLPAQKQYQVTGTREMVSSNPELAKTEKVSFTIGEALVADVIKALEPAGWSTTKEPQSQIFHTDDYPSYTLTFMAGTTAAKLFSTSQGSTATPWNLSLDQDLYFSKNEALGQVASKLFEQLKAQKSAS